MDAATTLGARREQLEEQLARMLAPAEDAATISFGKRIGDATSLAVDRIADVSAYDKLQAMLDEVKRAQAKLADGNYGRCDVCGNDIGSDRLEARPWATRCLADAATP
jgi:RNA polymerase-binding transcription factor DksA